jgi:hypothetical protein
MELIYGFQSRLQSKMSSNLPAGYPATRFARIFFSVVISLVVALVISALLWSDTEGHYLHRAAGPLLMVFFVAPYVAGFALITTFLFYFLDRLAYRGKGLAPKQSVAIVLILSAGVLIGFANPLVGTLSLFLLVYWLMTGRVAGRTGWSIRNFRRTGWDEKIYLAAMITLFGPLTGEVVSLTFYSLLPPQPGTPEYRVHYDYQLRPDLKRAFRRFPDAQSCLERGASAARREDLARMDWDKISTGGDAKVCMFRLLHEWGGVAEAAIWLEAQGF